VGISGQESRYLEWRKYLAEILVPILFNERWESAGRNQDIWSGENIWQKF
jgi:hypothetical protein